MLRRLLVAGLAMLILTGCGAAQEAPAAKAAASKSAAAEKAAADRAAAAEKQRAERTAIYKECTKIITPFDDALSGLNSRLSVGLPFADYSKQVGNVSVAHDKVIKKAKALGGVSDQCVNRVATPLEDALRAYVKAYNVWNACISDTYCTFDGDKLKQAQGSWSKASTLIDKAETALAKLRPA